MTVYNSVPHPSQIARAATTAAKLARVDHAWLDADTLLLCSATELGKMYRVTADGCTCQAAQHHMRCWHTEAYRMLKSEQLGTTVIAGPQTPEEIEIAEYEAQQREIERKQRRAARLAAKAELLAEAKMPAVRERMATTQYSEADWDALF